MSGPLSIDGQPLPPLPMTSKEARARGLSVYPSFARCRADGTHQRTTRGGRCVACQEREKVERKARDRAIADKVRAQTLKTARAQVLRELGREERQRQRDAEKAAAQTQREADRLAREKERRQQKAAETRAKKKAAAATKAPAAPAVDSSPPPWAEFADCLPLPEDGDDDVAPWD